MTNLENLSNFKKIYMLGIGGVSMSGIAEILKYWNFSVAGCDDASSENTEKLIDSGIPVTIGVNLEEIRNFDIVVYTAAISQDDPRLIHARELKIPTIERSDFLGYITKAFNNTICVAGTHGKTTTTSMVSSCFLEGKLDPTIQVGAFLNQINGNYRVGNSEYFILEACEYVESFLKFAPKSAIILNIDNDHLDYFKNFENIVHAFEKFVKLIPSDGLLVLNADDKSCLSLSKFTKARTITFAIENDYANFIARNIAFDANGFATFDVYYNNTFYKTISLSVPGKHNVYNALSCIALCYMYGLSKESIKNGLLDFKGAHRRFEYIGKIDDNAFVYDDYAHHPTEIKATASAVKQREHNHSWVIFQPHTYSRTKALLHEFAESLLDFDNIIITDIYAAREKNTFNVTSLDLVEEIRKLGKHATYISDFDDIVNYVKSNVSNNDLVLTLGAGTVVNISSKLINS